MRENHLCLRSCGDTHFDSRSRVARLPVGNHVGQVLGNALISLVTEHSPVTSGLYFSTK
ncbi:MAG: hypothetical protein L6422_12745 [Candidatus Marinimicrobia bacterium]|nr:hypothetical protein [Candidatus Neomarinimicrobiota bacterium]